MGKKYKGFKGSGMSKYTPASKCKMLKPEMLAKLMMLDLQVKSEHAAIKRERKERGDIIY